MTTCAECAAPFDAPRASLCSNRCAARRYRRRRRADVAAMRARLAAVEAAIRDVAPVDR